MKNLLLALIVLTTASLALAGGPGSGVIVAPSGMYEFGNTTNGAVTTNNNRTLIDGVLGYRLKVPVFLGGTYGYDSFASTTSSVTTTTTYSSYGPTVGYDSGNFYVYGTYFVGSGLSVTSGSITNTYTGGSGYQGAVGYRFNITNSFAISPQLDYKYLSYTSISINGAAATSVSYNYTSLLPYICLTFTFGGSGGGGD